MRMKLIAAGAAVAMMGPFAAVQAAADGEWYGRIHLSLDQYSDLDGQTVDTSDDGSGDWQEAVEGTYFASNSSRIGFSGSVEAGDLTLLGQIESGVGVGGDSWSPNRDSFVGLEGGFGKVLVGQLPAANQYVYDVNFFADQVGDAGAWQGGDNPGRTMAVWYGVEAASGLNISGTMLPAGHHGEDAGYGVRGHYAMGAMAFGLTQFSMQDVVGHDTTALSFRMDYGTGDVGVSHTSFAHGSDVDNQDDTVLNVGGTFELNDQGTVKAQYQMLNKDDSDADDATVLAVGYDHSFSDNVMGYAAYATSSEAGYGAVAQWGHADPALQGDGTATTEADGASASVISFGMMYNF